MSNHSGSYMLNEVLCLLYNNGFFNNLSKEKRGELIEGILDIGNQYDCNDGEILDELGKILRFCYSCVSTVEEFGDDDTICKKCLEE